MLARSVASLDMLSGGRVELGLGAGAFWDAIAADGGPRLTPGQAVDALAEAIDDHPRRSGTRTARSVTYDGEHYRRPRRQVRAGARARVELWLGAYKPRMLRADRRAGRRLAAQRGLRRRSTRSPAMNARIDAAARARPAAPGVRDPAAAQHQPRRTGPSELAELALEHGMSTFILSADDEREIQRFASEVAPAVRERVEARAAAAASRAPAPPADGRAQSFAVVPTPDDGVRLSDERAWDDGTRPTGPAPDPDARYTADQQAAGRHLIDVHDALRAELDQLRDLSGRSSAGSPAPTTSAPTSTR